MEVEVTDNKEFTRHVDYKIEKVGELRKKCRNTAPWRPVDDKETD
jgi:hypothetical protein